MKQSWTNGNILFVCRANVCRSPMATTIFNALAEDKGLPRQAQSAGVNALQGKPIAPNAVAALEELGISPENHRAQQVSETMLKESDLVLAMSPQLAAELRSLFGTLNQQIYTLPEYVTGVPDREGIPDPYGSTMVAYRASARQLFGYIDSLVNRFGL